ELELAVAEAHLFGRTGGCPLRGRTDLTRHLHRREQPTHHLAGRARGEILHSVALRLPLAHDFLPLVLCFRTGSPGETPVEGNSTGPGVGEYFDVATRPLRRLDRRQQPPSHSQASTRREILRRAPLPSRSLRRASFDLPLAHGCLLHRVRLITERGVRARRVPHGRPGAPYVAKPLSPSDRAAGP